MPVVRLSSINCSHGENARRPAIPAADAYDLGGRRTGTALGTGKTIATTYDSQGKPLTVTEGGRTTVYHYDMASRAVAQTQPNGLWQYNAYDNLGRLKSRQTYTSTDALQAQFLWTYDAVGNVTVQSERWPGEGARGAGWRSTVLVYDATNQLTGEAMAQPGSPVITTGYAYDTGSNRSVKLVSTDGTLTTQTLYTYNDFNQLTDWSEEDGLGAVTREAGLTYDLAGNRATQTLTVTGQSAQTTTYHWDAENRLEGVTLPNADEHEYGYDYRTRRIGRVENGIGTAIVFSGGLSVAEYESQGVTPTVEYLRGPDMGGGVGGMMYSLRNGGTEAKYAMSNGRGDVVAQSNDAGALTWTASYEAYGKRPVETGTNLDRQRANTKEEDPTGLLNEGFRYRDIETGVWLSRDPAGFVDGPNLYAYVMQNPWTSFDPEGLAEDTGYFPTKNGVATLERREKGNGYATQSKDGVEQVYARHYTDWADRNMSWVAGPYGKPNSEGWQPASDFGLRPVNTARKNFETNNDPQASAEAWMDAASQPAVKIAAISAQVSVEISAAIITAGASATFGNAIKTGGAMARADAGIAASAAPKGPVILGETMARVEARAMRTPGAKILNDMPDFAAMGMQPHQVTNAIMKYNRKWLLDQLRSGRPIIDLGRDPNRKIPSIFYQMEQNMLRNYQKLHPGSLNITTP